MFKYPVWQFNCLGFRDRYLLLRDILPVNEIALLGFMLSTTSAASVSSVRSINAESAADSAMREDYSIRISYNAFGRES